MSDAPRMYTSGLGKRRRRGKTGAWLRWSILAIFLILFIWFFWSTRDSHSMAELIPADAAYRVYVNGLVPKREEIVSAAVWTLAPPESTLAELQAQLAGNLGFPEWILNNLIYGLCQFSGNDTETFSDMIFVTRMSRIGCIIERFRGFALDVEDDAAGGLALRRIRDAELYYAVRGRVIVLSPSREAVIDAVTLLPDQALQEATLEQAAEAVDVADVYGSVSLTEPSAERWPIQDLTFELHFEPNSFRLVCDGQWTPQWQERLAGLVADARPQALTAPPSGAVEMSLNLNKNVRELWHGLGIALKDEGNLDLLWNGWANPEGEGGTPVSSFVTSLLGTMGPGLRLAWRDVDEFAVAPLPELILSGDADPALYEDLLLTMPAASEGAQPWQAFPRYEAEQEILYLPLSILPGLEPAGWIEGRHFVACTSQDLAGRLRGSDVSPETVLPEPGNVYVHVRPLAAANAAVKLAAPLAEAGLLRGYSGGGFEAAADEWRATAARVQDTTAYASFEDSRFRVRMDVIMVQPE